MEHIVQFGISIDDKVIADRIKNNAEKTITDKLFEEVKGVLFAGQGNRMKKSRKFIQNDRT